MGLIQIRNVPDDLHRGLKARAAREGVTLSELALTELRRSMEAPTRAELRERLDARSIVEYGGETAAESTRAERDSR